jgi:hypothetical protein
MKDGRCGGRLSWSDMLSRQRKRRGGGRVSEVNQNKKDRMVERVRVNEVAYARGPKVD